MKINSLYLKNIGPFLEAEIDFIGDNKKPPITIITGENGTGKTIILDAIRKMILSGWEKGRDICRNEEFEIQLNLNFSGIDTLIKANEKQTNSNSFAIKKDNTIYIDLFQLFGNTAQLKNNIWVTNYWTSQTDNSPFSIGTLQFLNPEKYLHDSLKGVQKNQEVTALITYFDYLKSSDNPKEREEGEFLFNTIKKIIKLSLLEGEFKYVERKNLMPVVAQNGSEVSLDKLSSGNLYLIQRMISLLGQMYSVYSLNNLKLEEMLQTPGLLLIDEAENHLHPKWQKTFLNSILSIFPNLQIIVTTHSPFIVSSVENARVYVCKSIKDHSILEDETDLYSNKPIDEVLVSDVFDTNPFNATITQLMEERKEAIQQNNLTKSEEIEEKLKAINPQYFSYFDIDKLLKQVSK